MDVTQAQPDRPRMDFGGKPQRQTPSLRQGTSHPMATPLTPSPANMEVQTNTKKELPRTIPLSSNESSVEKEEDMVTLGTEDAKVLGLASDNGTLSSDTEQNEVRLSHREKKSSLAYINGQAVLAKNDYQSKGLNCELGNEFQTAPPEKKPESTVTKPKAPKPRTELEVKRINHNDAPFLEESVTARLKQVSCVSSVDTPELYVQPREIQADMRDYQLDGLNWMVRMNKANLGMILGDEMGLGKTLQTISLLCHLKEREGVTGPSLVICPLSVLYSWCNELERWAPSLSFLRLHSSFADEREAQKNAFSEKATEYDVVITTYEMAEDPRLHFLWKRHYFNLLVLDEGHRMKDASSQIAQAVRMIHRENSLILTGTPIQNNLVKLWSLLSFLYPDVFSFYEPFASAFNLTANVIDTEGLLKTPSMLRCFMLRRLKDEVEKCMPKKIETKVICPLSNAQVFWYKALLLKDINLLARSDDDAPSSATVPKTQALSNLIMQLRKCCVHPFLFDGAEVGIDSTTCEDLIAASGKLTVLDMLLRSLYEKKHRVVLFSQLPSVLDILDDYCTMRGWKHGRFDGSAPRAQRNFIVNQFNAPDSDYFVFLMSTRSGSMRLNLQTADTCILFDSDWNLQPDIQAAARVHTIGQKKTVHVYRLVCGGTIEEQMNERAHKKLFLDQMVNQDSVADEVRVSKGELMSTLKFGCDAVFGEESENQNTLPSDHDVSVITDRNRSETFLDSRLKGGATNMASDFKAHDDLTSTTKLGGIDFKKIRDEHKKNKTKCVPKDIRHIADMWIKLQKRQRKSCKTNVEAEGSMSVPVLAANKDDLANGESSVPQREIGGRKGIFGEIKNNVKKSQDFCQVCADGGLLLCCPRCPVTVHQTCVGISNPNDFLACPHHRCQTCHKNCQAAGGLLFPCQSCLMSFCEKCLPTKTKGFRILGSCDRFVKLGFHSKNLCYIHCSESCEEWAKKEYKWSPPSTERAPTPAALDLSQAFGKPIDATVDEPEEIGESRLRKRKLLNYAKSDNVDHSLDVQPRRKRAKLKSVDRTEVDQPKSRNSKPSLSDGCPPPRNMSQPPPSNLEYDVLFPVTPHGLLFMMALDSDGKAIFDSYRRKPDGSKGPAELKNCVRNVGDRIVAVNQVNTSNLPYAKVYSLLRDCWNKKFARVRFRVSPRSMTPPLPSGFSKKEQPAATRSSHGTDRQGRAEQSGHISASPAVLWRASPRPPRHTEYDALLPISAKHGLMIRLGDLDGSAVFIGYSRSTEGDRGPAELGNLIRNMGDKIIAVNGVMTSSFHQVCHLMQESKRNAYGCCLVRLRETKDEGHSDSPSPSMASFLPQARRSVPAPSSMPYKSNKYTAAKLGERLAPDGSVRPVSQPKKLKDGLYQRPAGRTRHNMSWDKVKGTWVPSSNPNSLR